MKKLVLTKETIRDLSRSELEVVAGGETAPPGPKCCDGTGASHAPPTWLCETGNPC